MSKAFQMGWIQRAALELASRDRGVTSAELAKHLNTTIHAVSNSLSNYRKDGLLDGDESGRLIRYTITDAGLARLRGKVSVAKRYDFGPLIEAVGQ